MKKRLVINVTDENIQDGCPSSVHQCPIALAVAEKLDINSESVTVDKGAVFIEGYYECYDLSKKAKEFVRSFDRKQPVKSTKFVLSRS